MYATDFGVVCGVVCGVVSGVVCGVVRVWSAWRLLIERKFLQ